MYVDDSMDPEPDENTTTTQDNSYNLFTITGSGQNHIVLQVTCPDGARHWCFFIPDQQTDL